MALRSLFVVINLNCIYSVVTYEKTRSQCHLLIAFVNIWYFVEPLCRKKQKSVFYISLRNLKSFTFSLAKYNLDEIYENCAGNLKFIFLWNVSYEYWIYPLHTEYFSVLPSYLTFLIESFLTIFFLLFKKIPQIPLEKPVLQSWTIFWLARSAQALVITFFSYRNEWSTLKNHCQKVSTWQQNWSLFNSPKSRLFLMKTGQYRHLERRSQYLS